ncbi:MAG: RNA polymerase sigma factor [Acidimicrobiia bacterium]|nr:RNA polymerase sigma factor [Acidimicrobiia bacterium]
MSFPDPLAAAPGPSPPTLVPPPFRLSRPGLARGRPLLTIYSLLAMAIGDRDQGLSVGDRAESGRGGNPGSDPGATDTVVGGAVDGAAARAAKGGQQGRGTTVGSDKEGGSAEGADPDELHNLVVEHGDAIYRLALSVVRDQALAEDVAQEALVKAWLALPSFRGDASLRSWLLRITHNTAISTLRRRRAVVLDPQDLPEQETRVERSVESRVQGELVMDHFVAALDTLDELSRSIVVLRELEGLTYEEISEVLAVPMPTVKTRLLRARRRLGNALREWA